MKYYLISDTHFNHKMLIEKNYRPEGYDEKILKAISMIPGDSVLLHLGDFSMGKDKEAVENYIQKSNAYKNILVRGNHDCKCNSWYERNGFDFVCDSFSIRAYGKKIIFSHHPLANVEDYDFNIHGHLHDFGYQDFKHCEKHILVSLELSNYKINSLENIIK